MSVSVKRGMRELHLECGGVSVSHSWVTWMEKGRRTGERKGTHASFNGEFPT
jgi:hypothetical protein